MASAEIYYYNYFNFNRKKKRNNTCNFCPANLCLFRIPDLFKPIAVMKLALQHSML